MIQSIGSNIQNLKIFGQSHQTATEWLSPISSTEVKPVGHREFRLITALQSDDPSTAKAAIISINQSERGQRAKLPSDLE
jgi:hypothetical protein